MVTLALEKKNNKILIETHTNYTKLQITENFDETFNSCSYYYYKIKEKKKFVLVIRI